MTNKKTATIAFGGIIIIVALVRVVVNVTKGKNNDNNTTVTSKPQKPSQDENLDDVGQETTVEDVTE